jgi:hypothetical protein
MIGCVLKTFGQQGAAGQIVGSAEEYAETLATQFGIELPQAAALWPSILRRHRELFGG